MTKHNQHNLKNPLYLNANLIYSECLNYLKQEHWRRKIKTGTLSKLREDYNLITSILTRMEVIQNLCLEENIPKDKARNIYHQVLEDYGIRELTSLHRHIELNDPLIDSIALTNLRFQDALHLLIAKKAGMPVCTHDKKMLGNYSTHGEKFKFYEKIHKPHELLSNKQKR